MASRPSRYLRGALPYAVLGMLALVTACEGDASTGDAGAVNRPDGGGPAAPVAASPAAPAAAAAAAPAARRRCRTWGRLRRRRP